MSDLIGKKLISLPLAATGGQTTTSKDLEGNIIIFYFYPKDDTPGCTKEGQDFTKLYEPIQKQGAIVFGVSKDSLASHEKFKAKYNYKWELISDEDAKLCDFFQVIKEKNMYGKKYKGIERSTFVIDSKGILIKEWRTVKVEGHAQEVLEFIQNLKS